MSIQGEQIGRDPASLDGDRQAGRSAHRIPGKHAPRVYRYYDFIMAAFVTVMLCSNLISAPKRVEVFGLTFGAGVLFFPISYLFGDILTEVYGYARSRRVVWAGFAALAFATIMTQVVMRLPAAPGWKGQSAFEAVFGGTWRIVLASIVAFLVGEFTNSYVLARMKVMTAGRFLWTRTIGSTMFGEMADSLVFYPIAFLGRPGWTPRDVLVVMATNYALKVGWEVLATPMTYGIVGYLKRSEDEDYFDRGTNFTPFSLEA